MIIIVTSEKRLGRNSEHMYLKMTLGSALFVKLLKSSETEIHINLENALECMGQQYKSIMHKIII